MNRITAYDISKVMRSMVSYVLSFSIIIVLVPILMVLLLIPEPQRYENKLLYIITDIIYKGIVWSMLMPMSIEGSEHMPQEPAIIIANHQSSLDIPIVGSLLDAHSHIWFALIDFMNTPVLGYLIKKMGIWVDRKTSLAGARAILQGIKAANDYKAHLVLFPEGGRFYDGEIHTFLRGFAIIAKKTGRNVIPVYMPNNWRIFPTRRVLFGYEEIRILIGPPFIIQPDESEEAFTNRVYSWFITKKAEETRS